MTFCTEADISKFDRNGTVTDSFDVMYTIGTSTMGNKYEKRLFIMSYNAKLLIESILHAVNFHILLTLNINKISYYMHNTLRRN